MTGRQRIDHLVWDWNGTLFNDNDALVTATIDAFSAAGVCVVTRAHYRTHYVRPISRFYDQLAGRELSPAEQAALSEHFQRLYAEHIENAVLVADAEEALAAWAATGRSQSLLSMYPHEKLVALVADRAISRFFGCVDGLGDDESPLKEPHLRRHLSRLEVNAAHVLVIGDSVDDVDAAVACGAASLLYHPGEAALHSWERVRDLGVPVVESLTAAVDLAISGTGGPERPAPGSVLTDR